MPTMQTNGPKRLGWMESEVLVMVDEALAGCEAAHATKVCGLRSTLCRPSETRAKRASVYSLRPTAHSLLAVILTASLSACGGGGDHVGIGSGPSAPPVVPDFPIFSVKRPVPPSAATDDITRKRRFLIGADLYMRDRASVSAAET